jgi:hypothetical protein
MLKKTVYFRDQEDLNKFNAIANKAEWLHEHLKNVSTHDINWKTEHPVCKICHATVVDISLGANCVPLEPTYTDPEDVA